MYPLARESIEFAERIGAAKNGQPRSKKGRSYTVLQPPEVADAVRSTDSALVANNSPADRKIQQDEVSRPSPTMC
jgi:hypothetical protein